jgi:hypothetical protein
VPDKVKAPEFDLVNPNVEMLSLIVPLKVVSLELLNVKVALDRELVAVCKALISSDVKDRL